MRNLPVAKVKKKPREQFFFSFLFTFYRTVDSLKEPTQAIVEVWLSLDQQEASGERGDIEGGESVNKGANQNQDCRKLRRPWKRDTLLLLYVCHYS